jgi:hypothetical protein
MDDPGATVRVLLVDGSGDADRVARRLILSAVIT